MATTLVCDSLAMREYYLQTYRAASAYIPYGGVAGDPPRDDAPAHFGLEAGRYHLVVARLEPENNVDLVIREYKASQAQLPLVYVGGARYESDYSRSVFAETDERGETARAGVRIGVAQRPVQALPHLSARPRGRGNQS